VARFLRRLPTCMPCLTRVNTHVRFVMMLISGSNPYIFQGHKSTINIHGKNTFSSLSVGFISSQSYRVRIFPILRLCLSCRSCVLVKLKHTSTQQTRWLTGTTKASTQAFLPVLIAAQRLHTKLFPILRLCGGCRICFI
jgi:hypothetical protein